MVQHAVAAFLETEAAAVVVLGYAYTLDAYDRQMDRSVFTGEIMLPYGAISSFVANFSADEWTEPWHTMESFDTNAHQVQNRWRWGKGSVDR